MQANNLKAEDSNMSLYERYVALKQEDEKIRARDAAEKLGVSEGELLASRIGKDEVRRLDDSPEEILEAILPLGEVMGLTRNESCVHERKGIYDNFSVQKTPHMKVGLFVNPDIDLRLFLNHWKFCFAAVEQTRGGPRKSIQFFDKSGTALHKVYLTPKSNEDEYDKLVEKFTAKEQPEFIEVEDYEPKKADREDSEIDTEGLEKAWSKLKDTHDFYPMLGKFKVGRTQAHRLVSDEYAYEVPNSSARQALDLARDKNCEIMVFVGNRGCIGIHTGPVKKLMEYGSWYNVMDPMFNLHLNEEKIGETWVTRKPTEDGIVTAVEVFDSKNELIVTFFGKRKPGIPELELWREIVSEIPKK